MEKSKRKSGIQIGILIIASAIVWGAVIVGCSYKLKGTECYDEISTILFGGMIMHFFLIWAPLSILSKNKNTAKQDEN